MTWPVALSAVVVSTRIRGGVDDSEDTSVRHHQVHGMGPLVIYMIAPLLLHTCLYYNSSVDIELKPPRDTLALGITLILGAMASSYHCLLRIENRRLAVRESDTRARLAHQAFHDQLTGLPNRNLFRDRLQVTIEEAARQKGHGEAITEVSSRAGHRHVPGETPRQRYLHIVHRCDERGGAGAPGH